MKIKEKVKKMGLGVYSAIALALIKSNSVFAEIVSIDSNGGKIRESAVGKGIFDMAQDMSGTLRWLIPVVSIPFILWFLFKMFSGEEQEQPRYKKKLITTLIIVMASTLVTVIVNLIMGYFS
ncbi:MAG: hypothetical protein J6A89_01720 [Clostridia bacterium]|nr:hypothetical protein [Clostridia bacterium]